MRSNRLLLIAAWILCNGSLSRASVTRPLDPKV